jgi:hypothetical protein
LRTARSIWLEIKSDNVEDMNRRILDFALVRKLEMPDPQRESTDFQGHCSMRWAVFLLSLKDVPERGKGRPVPYDLEVHYR